MSVILHLQSVSGLSEYAQFLARQLPGAINLTGVEIYIMKNLCAAIVAGVAVMASGVAMAGDATAGKAKSATCAGCHGPAGISNNPLWPNLAGQKEAYLVKQMKAFRDGTRTDPMMAPMAKPLTDEDIANLATYYSGL